MLSVVQNELDKIQKGLYARAQQRLVDKTFKLSSYAEMKKMLQDASTGSSDAESSGKGNFQNAGFYLVPWKVFYRKSPFLTL
jgi:hypothetical protein